MRIYFTVIAVLAILVTAISFFQLNRAIKNNLFSYRTIFNMGFSLFMLFQAVVYGYLAFVIIPYNTAVNADELKILLAGSGFNYMLITFPFILVFAVSISISNIALIRHEGKRLINLLGMAIGFAMLFNWVVIVLIDLNFSGNDDAFYVYITIGGLYSLLYAYFECMLFGTIICAVMAAKKNPKYNKDYIIILGCKVKKDGSLYPLIKGRADRAIEFYNAQLMTTGKKATFIASGGQGSDEVISEGKAVANYLLSAGISEENVIAETESKTTRENMRFSKAIMDERSKEGYIAAFSTTNYHVYRSGIIAGEEGLYIDGMGAKTKWYFWPNAFMREFAGLFVNSIKHQTLILSSIVMLYLVATYIIL